VLRGGVVAWVAMTLILSGGRDGRGQGRRPGQKTRDGVDTTVHGSAPALARARRLDLLDAQDWERQLRQAIDVGQAPGADRVTGPDPYLLRALPGDLGFVGLLRGSAEIVLLDADLRIVDRAPAPRAPTGMVVSAGGEVYVCGELSAEIVRYQVAARSVRRAGAIALAPGHGARDLAAGPRGLLYAVDQRAGGLLTIQTTDVAPGAGPSKGDIEPVAWRHEIPIGHGPIRVARVGSLLIVDLLLDHALVVLRADEQGRPCGELARIQHDGPIWSFDAALVPGRDQVLIATVGVEDHPLDRTIGSFGYIDSFLTIYSLSFGPPSRLPAVPARATRLSLTNLSAIGVVTPKVVDLQLTSSSSPPSPFSPGVRAIVTGYGSDTMATLDWPRLDAEPTVVTRPLPPGTTSMLHRTDGALIFADPLLDAWLISTTSQTITIPSGSAPSASAPSPPFRRASPLGEALFYTTLIAPWNRADGPASRFTCETCHFEGGVDGRTHHTGRGDVKATTKPLRGLINNHPYFSRALDPDLATMVNNEFRVAGANSGRDPWFDLRVADFPWLRTLEVADQDLSAAALRRALMSFLAQMPHFPNPQALSAIGYDPGQRAGALVFRDRCESCHQARLATDDPGSRVPFPQWERSIFSEADPILWASPDYRQTGVVPYVHERGARVPSLRRLSAKFPYFTNGTARSLEQVIARARFAPDGSSDHFSHDHDHDHDHDDLNRNGGDALDPASAAALAAFLQLL
jgi:hypothetical protein